MQSLVSCSGFVLWWNPTPLPVNFLFSHCHIDQETAEMLQSLTEVMKAQLSLNLSNSQLKKCQTKKYRTTFRLFCVSTVYRHHFDLVEHQTSVKQLVCMTFTATLLHISVAYKVCLCEVRSSKTKQWIKIILNQKTDKSHSNYIYVCNTKHFIITTFIIPLKYNDTSFTVT